MGMANQINERQRRVAKALRALDFADTEAKEALSRLASSINLESMELFEDEIQVTGATFRGPALWHVQLLFNNPDGDMTVSESFPGSFEGRFEDEKPVVEH